MERLRAGYGKRWAALAHAGGMNKVPIFGTLFYGQPSRTREGYWEMGHSLRHTPVHRGVQRIHQELASRAAVPASVKCEGERMRDCLHQGMYDSLHLPC